MATSPSISLALIVKNEEKNINRLLESVDGCFDEIILVDTGSTDKTVEIAKSLGCQIHHFEWINDFAAARNFAFSKCTKDFVMWLDADDVLSSRESFIQWKRSAMQFADYFLATYNYALNDKGEPVCSFVRERVFRRKIGPTWQYPIHEGVIMRAGWAADRVPSTVWTVNHLRDAEDIKADKSRNLTIFELLKDKGQWDGRMQFYYAKELYEAQRPLDSLVEFRKATERKDIEHHDRILAFQYGAYAAQAVADQLKPELTEEKKKYLEESIRFSYEGLKLDAGRAEFYVIIGDAHLKQNNLMAALPSYGAAKACINHKATGSPYEGAIYSFVDCYGLQPQLQMARIYFHIGMLDMAEKEAKEAVEKYNSKDAQDILTELEKIKPLVTIDQDQEQTEDIVFTCPPHQAYPFDEEVYETKPLGGSETALVQMAKELKAITGRPVKVFNVRDSEFTAKSGVEYIPNRKVNEYFSKKKPRAHLAWRHNIQLTKAKTYLWAHDLFTQTVEAKQNFDKMLCLSEFHKNLTMGKCGVPEKNIIVTRNGITPEKFIFDRPKKNPNKFVYMSSPDRGLYGAILIVDEVRKVFPEVELHCYYGMENLRKYGLVDLADKIEALLPSRPWVKMHGFTEQAQMYREVADAVVLCHPATFIETYCITMLEMLALGVYPVTRRLGALQDTLAEAEAKGMATLLESDNLTHYITPEEVHKYAAACIEVVQQEKWKNIDFDMNENSWHAVAKTWVKQMEL